MPTFRFSEQLTAGGKDVISAKLNPTNSKLTDANVGYPVKLGADSRYDLCSDGNQIEGFVTSVEPYTVENSSFGGVQVSGFKNVTVYGPIAIGDFVVAETNGRVKKAPAVTSGDATTVPVFRWQYVSGQVGSSGTGVYTGVVRRVS